MLDSAHKGYDYQDLLSAYFVAQYIASSKLDVEFLFDSKDFDGDKFDDLKIYDGDKSFYRQIKQSDSHSIEKNDFSAPDAHDLYLKDLFDSWLKQKDRTTEFRLCLAWNSPQEEDEINQYLKLYGDNKGLFPETDCYRIDCDSLWSLENGISKKWLKLRKDSTSIDRNLFKSFLDSLIVEIKYPSMDELNKLLVEVVKKIGIGKYPNKHLRVEEVCEKLQSIVRHFRASGKKERISAKQIAEGCSIVLNYGGIEESFPIDYDSFIDVSERLQTIKEALKQRERVIATAEPGAGKSWLIASLEKELKKDGVQVLKHYCYVDLKDSLFSERVKTDSLYGSLKTQIRNLFPEVICETTYAADSKEIVFLLNQIKSKVLLIVDGVDHVKRVYARDSYEVAKQQVDIITAIKQLNFINPNVQFLVISQPLDEFQTLNDFFQVTIPPITKKFVKAYIAKSHIEDKELRGIILSDSIYEKSHGNALYCKYLVEYAKKYASSNDFTWLNSLPPYDYNLESYYKYIYEELDGKIEVPAALCGVDFSLSKDELIKITGIGKCVDKQLDVLIPILRFNPAYGYSVYHESFKRYLFKLFEKNQIDIGRKVYTPLIDWLKDENFYKNQKSYACLLRLYYELKKYDKILETVSESFLEESMLNACSFEDMNRNHTFQKKALIYSERIDDFKLHIILAEQSKMLLQIDYMGANDFEDYIEAVKYNISREKAHDFIQRDGGAIGFDSSSLIRYMSKRALIPSEQVYWELCDFGDPVDLEDTRDNIICFYLQKHSKN